MSCSTAGITACGSNAGSTARRQNMPSEMTMKTLATVGMSSVGGDAALVLQLLEQLLEALDDEAVEALVDLADARVARRLQADVDAHAVHVGRLFEEILLAEHAQRLEKVGGVGQRRQALGELGAVALGDAGDQRFLAVEVDVERAGADARLLADVVDGGAVEAGAGEARSAASRMCSLLAR